MGSRARPASGVSRTAWDDYGGARPDSQFDFGQDGIRDDPDLGPSGNESVYNGSGANPKSGNAVATTGSSKPTSFCGKIGKGIRSLWATRQTEDVKGDRELHVKTTLRELIVYIVFLVILCIITFGMTSTTMYYYTKVMSDLFLDTTSTSGGSFRTITSVEDFWKFAKGPLMKGLYWETWYNNVSVPEDQLGYIYYENKLLGVPRMRQLQVHSNSCVVHDDFKDVIRECYESYSESLENKEPFGLKDTETAWYYKSNDELDGSSHWGLIATYSGAGYVQDLNRNLSLSAAKIDYLFNNRWIQRGTRIVFIDFTVYNANINLFCVVRLTVEFPPTGGAIPHATMRTVKLIRYVTVMDYFIMACEFIFCLFLTYYMIEEAIEIKKHKFAYFKNFWNILDIVVIVIALVCVAFNVYRLIKVNDLLSDLLNKPDEYADFVFLGYGQTQFDNAIAIAVFFAWIKIFKYISFNKTMTQLSSTLGKCAKDLAGFAVMFFIIFLAFTQLGYLLFGTQVKDFSNFQNSFFTLFRIILGDFDFDQLEAANRVLGPIFFMLFVFFVFFVLINMFLAIINDTYSEVKGDMANQKNEFEMTDYFKRGYDKMISKLNFKHDKIVDIQKALDHADMNNDKQVDFNEWRQDLKTRGYADAEIEAVFAKYDLDGDRVLDEAEQRKMKSDLMNQKMALKQEFADLKEMGGRPESAHRSTSRVSINDGSGSDSDEEDSRTKSSRSGPSQSVAYEEFTVLSRRVDRMEHSIGSIVSKIDAVLVKLELMEKAKLKRRETMGKILDSITESDGTTDEVKREQMERLVREELERWDSESSVTPQLSGRGASPGSGGRAGARSRSRPDSGGNSLIEIDEDVLAQFDDKSDDDSIDSLDISLLVESRVESRNVSKHHESGVGTAHTSLSVTESHATSTNTFEDAKENIHEQIRPSAVVDIPKDDPINIETKDDPFKKEILNEDSNNHCFVSLDDPNSACFNEKPMDHNNYDKDVPLSTDINKESHWESCSGDDESQSAVKLMSENEGQSKGTNRDDVNKKDESFYLNYFHDDEQIESQTGLDSSKEINFNGKHHLAISVPQVEIEKQLKYSVLPESNDSYNRLPTPPQRVLSPPLTLDQQAWVKSSQELHGSVKHVSLPDRLSSPMQQEHSKGLTSLRESDLYSSVGFDELSTVKDPSFQAKHAIDEPAAGVVSDKTIQVVHEKPESHPIDVVGVKPHQDLVKSSTQEPDADGNNEKADLDIRAKSQLDEKDRCLMSPRDMRHLSFSSNTSPPNNIQENEKNLLKPQDYASSSGKNSFASVKDYFEEMSYSKRGQSDPTAKESDSINGKSKQIKVSHKKRHASPSSKSKERLDLDKLVDGDKTLSSCPDSEPNKAQVKSENIGKHKPHATLPKSESRIREFQSASKLNKIGEDSSRNPQQTTHNSFESKAGLKDYPTEYISPISPNLSYENDRFNESVEQGLNGDQSKARLQDVGEEKKKKRKERRREKHGSKQHTRAGKSAVTTDRGQKVSIGTLAKKFSTPDDAKSEKHTADVNEKDANVHKSSNLINNTPNNDSFLPKLLNPYLEYETRSKHSKHAANRNEVATFRYSKHTQDPKTITVKKVPYSVVPGSMSLSADTDVLHTLPDGDDKPASVRNQVSTHTSCKTPVMEKVSTTVFV